VSPSVLSFPSLERIEFRVDRHLRVQEVRVAGLASHTKVGSPEYSARMLEAL
jgi:hypothetical protein